VEIRHKTPTLLHREPDSTPYVMANWKTKQWRNTCNILFTQIIQAIGSDQLSQIAGILTRRHSGSFSAVWRIILDHVKIHRGYGTRKDSPPLKKFQDSVEALITQQTSAFLPIVFRVHLQKTFQSTDPFFASSCPLDVRFSHCHLEPCNSDSLKITRSLSNPVSTRSYTFSIQLAKRGMCRQTSHCD